MKAFASIINDVYFIYFLLPRYGYHHVIKISP